MADSCSPSREIEIKLDIDPSDALELEALPCFSGEEERQRQITVYFDTPKEKLRRGGWVLRVRQVDGRFTQTVKCSGSPIPIERDEWEEEISGLRPEAKAIARTPLGDVLKGRQIRQLTALCRCDVERVSRTVANGKGSFELTYDQGLVEAREACEPIHEIELEMKAGNLEALFASARRIVRQVPAKIGVLAKSERGFRLADGRINAPVKATPVVLRARMSVAEGFATVAAACLKHFRMNEPLLIAERDAEALHQMRVSIRRLRSAFWLFRPAIRDAKVEAFEDQLRRFTREMGAARNIDVILASLPLDDPARGNLEDNRKRLYSRLIRKLDSRSFRLFMFELFAWVQTGKWRSSKKAMGPLMPFAIKRLDRLWTRINRKAEGLGRLSDVERHKLRISTKKMRYAVEFLAEPFRNLADERARFVNAAEGVQDRLGELNDLATRQELLFGHAHETDRKFRSRHLRAAKRHFGKLRDIGAFWGRYEA
ncbi:CHAD domain-containing protein [Sphingomonas sp. NSE70-1]|uniref:CHAD domain-containing protein n=1 Tax=Sphingomonas caseinilyticus TaxID=2908205 RepID=A0ABT0RU66_9SPHN|nr:CHAD domain-containing protein [Sphingomonas caseinilyticus]MCL6698570.1 CHAD domain-containing protein [Sphingomonas caseinilyticus]